MFKIKIFTRESFGGEVFTETFDTLKAAERVAREEAKWESCECVRVYEGDKLVDQHIGVFNYG